MGEKTLFEQSFAFSRKSNLARKALLNEDDSFEDFNLDKSYFTMENDELSFFSYDDFLIN